MIQTQKEVGEAEIELISKEEKKDIVEIQNMKENHLIEIKRKGNVIIPDKIRDIHKNTKEGGKKEKINIINVKLKKKDINLTAKIKPREDQEREEDNIEMKNMLRG